MRRIPVVLVLAACAKSAPEPARPAEPAAQPSSGCNDADASRVMNDSFAAVERYFGEIAKLVPAWSDCEVARKDFVGLEPEAKRFVEQVTKTKAFMDGLSPECRDRLKENADATAKALQMEERFGHLEDDIKAVLERCKDHPGFDEAVGRGLTVMKKKKS